MKFDFKTRCLSYLKRYQTFILYALFGIPPTLVSFGGYALLINLFSIKAFLASGISWTAALIVSFFLYRRFVFQSYWQNTGLRKILVEFFKFTALRICSGAMETGFVWFFVDFWGFHQYLFKVIASFLAALFNFCISKLFVFKAQRDSFKRRT